MLQSFADYTPFTLCSPIDGSADHLLQRQRGGAHARSRRSTRPPAAIARCGTTASSTASTPGCRSGITLFGGGMSERTIAQVCDENCEPEPAALLRPDPERHPVPHAVQDRRVGAAEVRHPGQLLVPEPARLPSRHAGAVRADRHVAARAAADQRQPAPNGAGTVWLITPTTRYTVCPGNSASQGCVVGALVDPGMTVASLHVPLVAPNDRVRRSHQSARSQHLEDDQVRPGERSSRRSTSSTC